MDRHSRQIRLVDIGLAGQARIARAVVDVPGHGLAAVVAAKYLAGAGVAALRVEDAAARDAARSADGRVRVEALLARGAPMAPAPGPWHDEAARAVAGGALHALRALREALEVAS